ncbi:unnamed protein product [Sphagnum troendelagicum]|uniref:Uncharacterized protein n=1 Tax=Sphagnum troendelagicum TaxID=128251 RepID=A0ABP0UXR7_9BRYO
MRLVKSEATKTSIVFARQPRVAALLSMAMLQFLVLNRGRLTSSVPSAAHENLDSSKQRTLEKLQFTAGLGKVIQTLVDIDLKMTRCHAELHAALSAVDKLEEGHGLFLFLPTRGNETAAALKLVNSVQQSVSDCHSALVLSHDPGDLHSNNRKVAAADLESAVLQIQAASDYLQY